MILDINISTILMVALFASLIGFAFYIMQLPDMIFYKYSIFLNYLANAEFKTIQYRIFEFKLWYNITVVFKFSFIELPRFNLSNSHYFRCGKHISHSRSKFLYYITKPLGRCIICNTTWIGIIITFLLFNLPILPMILLSIGIGMTSASLVTLISSIYNKIISI